jgi:hypothetical protein
MKILKIIVDSCLADCRLLLEMSGLITIFTLILDFVNRNYLTLSSCTHHYIFYSGMQVSATNAVLQFRLSKSHFITKTKQILIIVTIVKTAYFGCF